MPSPFTDPLIAGALAPFAGRLPFSALAQVRQYAELLLRWNAKINLTTITEPRELLARHFGESMFAAQFLPAGPLTVADIGTGAGFPGLALKIARPDTVLWLIEPNRKKSAFLSEVRRVLELPDVKVIPARFAEAGIGPGQLDVVTSRALGTSDDFLEWSKGALRSSGSLILWIGAQDAQKLSNRGESFSWRVPEPIPGSRERVLLVGTPVTP